MSNIQLSPNDIRKAKRGPGRTPIYGEKAITRPVNYPPVLLEKLRKEATLRGVRAEDPSEWTVSRVVVDICCQYFGIPNPSREGAGND